MAGTHRKIHHDYAQYPALKDAMSRDILRALDEAHIGIASSTYDVVGMPPLRVELEPMRALAASPSAPNKY